MVKNPPAMQETRVQSLGQENTLKEGMATHFSILAWRIPGTEEPGRLLFIGYQRVGHDLSACTHKHKLGTKKFKIFPGDSNMQQSTSQTSVCI